VPANSLDAWIQRYSKPRLAGDKQAELRRLREECKRVYEERDILKKAAAHSAKSLAEVRLQHYPIA
jgi:transposase